MAFDWKIMAVKGLKSAAIVFLTGLIAYWQNDAKYMILIPVIDMALNWLKHRKDE
jgi:hypothetical protein